MPWLIGHQAAEELQPRPDRKGQQVRSMLSEGMGDLRRRRA
jgi:hypothetical protein